MHRPVAASFAKNAPKQTPLVKSAVWLLIAHHVFISLRRAFQANAKSSRVLIGRRKINLKRVALKASESFVIQLLL
jgi:hypothetical protein